MPRRVLHVVGVHPRRVGGVERQLHELSRQFEARGWLLSVCMPSAPQGVTHEFLQSANIEVIADPDVFSAGPGSLRSAWRLFRTVRPDVVHLSFVSGLSLLPWAAWMAGVRTILFTDQSSRPEGFVPRRAPLPKRWMGRIILWPLRYLISISDYVRRCNVELGYCPQRKQLRIYNAVLPQSGAAVSVPAADLRARFGIGPTKLLVTQVSWLIPEKGVHDLLRAARLALDLYPDLHFFIAGDGHQRARLEALREELGLTGSLTLAGLIADPFAEGVCAATDISCHFARWNEAFGWAVAEAMSMGKPVVGSRVGAIPEIIQDGVTGCLVDPGDPKALAERIVELAKDPARRQTMGEAARHRAETCFNLITTTRELLNLYG